MAGATARKSLAESVPAEYQEAAKSLIAQLKEKGGNAGQCEALLRTIIFITKNDHEGSADRSLNSIRHIISDTNFKPRFLEQMETVAERSGPRAAVSLDALKSVFRNHEMNQYALHAISLVANSAPESTSEALLCLEKLLENPEFSKKAGAFNFSFATRFDSWISQTLKRCDNPESRQQALQALSSLMGNPGFGIEEFNSDAIAVKVGKAIALSAGSRYGSVIELDALSHLFKNPNIKPGMVDEKLSAELSLVIDKVMRNTTKYVSREATWNKLNRILENRRIGRQDIDAETGLLSNIAGKSRAGAGLNMDHLESLLSAKELDPGLLDAIRLASTRAKIMPPFFLNPALRIVYYKESWKWAGKNTDELVKLLSGSGSEMHSIEGRSHAYVYFGEILKQWEGDARILKFLNRAVELSGDMIPQVANLLDKYLKNRGLKEPPDESLVSSLVSACKPIWTGPNDDKIGFQGLGEIVSSASFNPDMLKEDGLVGMTIRKAGPNAGNALDELGGLFVREIGGSAEVQPVIRRIILQSGENSALALKAFNDFTHENMLDKFTLKSLDFILPLCRSRCDLVLPLWSSLLKQGMPSEWEKLKPYGESLVALAFIGANKSGQKQFDAIRSMKYLMYPDPSPSLFRKPVTSGFKPEHIERLISVAQKAGPDCPYVMEAIKEQLTEVSRKIPQEMILGQEYLDGMVKLFRTVSVLAWPKQEQALSELAGSMGSNNMQLAFVMQKAHDIAALAKDRRAEVLAAYLPLWTGHHSDEHLEINLKSNDYVAINDGQMVSWITKRLDSVPEKDRPRMVSSIGAFFHSSPKSLVVEALGERGFEAGQRLADSLAGKAKNDPAIYANFAYAIRTIGAEKTARLHSELGIEFFFRYSKDMLEGLYADLDPQIGKERPLLMVVMNKSDYNGAFYNEGRQLESLKSRYRVMISETDKEEGFYSSIQKAGARFGKRPDALVIAGHGSEDSIALGPDKNDERDELDLTDIVDMVKLRYLLAPKPTIILDSCSTGYNSVGIGSMISKSVPDATLFAPEVPTNVKRYYFSPDGKPRVEFEDSRAAFLSGQKVGKQE